MGFVFSSARFDRFSSHNYQTYTTQAYKQTLYKKDLQRLSTMKNRPNVRVNNV
ncbi:hypothetical protein BSPWISOXPB_1241 [uncultured Gammaproteobacteria bacterium]|nr:hypothetical protein BSPWISOXPB_1241 [uncultured Gammaproteobacteria bacterium]